MQGEKMFIDVHNHVIVETLEISVVTMGMIIWYGPRNWTKQQLPS